MNMQDAPTFNASTGRRECQGIAVGGKVEVREGRPCGKEQGIVRGFRTNVEVVVFFEARGQTRIFSFCDLIPL